jgi:hypothetical protein
MDPKIMGSQRTTTGTGQDRETAAITADDEEAFSAAFGHYRLD